MPLIKNGKNPEKGKGKKRKKKNKKRGDKGKKNGRKNKPKNNGYAMEASGSDSEKLSGEYVCIRRDRLGRLVEEYIFENLKSIVSANEDDIRDILEDLEIERYEVYSYS